MISVDHFRHKLLRRFFQFYITDLILIERQLSFHLYIHGFFDFLTNVRLQLQSQSFSLSFKQVPPNLPSNSRLFISSYPSQLLFFRAVSLFNKLNLKLYCETIIVNVNPYHIFNNSPLETTLLAFDQDIIHNSITYMTMCLRLTIFCFVT